MTHPYWSLPGGRVELHESGAETLAREIEEEIGCAARIGPLRFIIENFFCTEGRKFHEIGFYYDAELSRSLPFHENDVIHRSRDGNADLEFRWIPPVRTALDALDLQPLSLRRLIETMPAGVEHVVQRDSRDGL